MRAGAAVAAAAPIAGFPAVVKRRKPNEMLSHAAIGCGNQAWYDLNQLASHPDLNVTALCDVDSRYLENAHKRFPNARIYRDAFEMFLVLLTVDMVVVPVALENVAWHAREKLLLVPPSVVAPYPRAGTGLLHRLVEP